MDSNGLTVLSLFDGMSCGAIALREAGIKVKQYFASEIDKAAIIQATHNFPDTIQLGSVVNLSAANLPKIDLLIGGSPCQGFSFAGKQMNFKDPRSVLFFEYVRILNEIRAYNPDVKFLLENVRMRAEYENVISSHLGLQPVAINSSLVSAQNRLRLYWTNILTTTTPHLFGETVFTAIPQPKDKGIYLRDVLDDVADTRFFLSRKDIEKLEKQIAYESERQESIPVERFMELFCDIDFCETYTLAPVSCFCPENWISNHTIRPSPKIERFPVSAIQNGKAIRDCSSNTDSTVIISGAIVSPQFGGGFRPILSGKAPCLLATSSNSAACLIINGDDMVLRRLTPKECCRLQTIPDWYEWVCSEPQIYKMLGNGWTVDVISHILQFL